MTDALQQASEQMQGALRSIDTALASTSRTPGLGELERDAVVQLRAEQVHLLRRLRNVRKFLAPSRTTSDVRR